MSRLLRAALVAACLATVISLPPALVRAADPPKVAIIVGPVGSLTPTYLALAEAAASTAERHGATVARAYSPNATPANVLAAVADANVIVYFGHGYGHPSPYGGLNTARQNGWGLQGPRAHGTHGDSLNGELAYYGEDWIVANARPAPGFVMIYSNTCYAPGASEGGFAPATPQVAAQRVAYYSRKVFAMGGSAYFATDFDRGAADLVERILANPATTYGTLFASDHRFVPGALTAQPHPFSAGQQIWLHRTKYTDGPPNYWYAFAGNPDATPMRSWDPVAPTVALERPAAADGDVDPWVEPKLRFSEPVDGVSASTVRLLDGDGDVVPAEVVHNRATGAVRLVPVADLELSERYTISVEPGLSDEAGNRLTPIRWSFATRLDADPLAQPLPAILAPGIHRLARVSADGRVEEERSLTLVGEREAHAAARARLPGVTGSWLRLSGSDLDGWWVLESSQARVPGRIEEVAFEPVEITLPAAPNDGAATPEGEAPVRDRRVTVDRRAVVDGRTLVHVVRGQISGEGPWVVAPAEALPADLAEIRVLEQAPRPEPAVVRIEDGAWPAFRLDDRGRVVERRTLEPGHEPLPTTATISLGGRSFHAVTGGALEGWLVPDGAGVAVDIPEAHDPS